ncbi:DUF1329 domain-containing protein [Pseudomonas sp. MWU13-2105]|jgi:hypothetical protein|uniref:DUF1329 domain-containing protein n=1 Tax=Pseudomonas sp. MWU13-2105 TaxID=2935074 RepID=UPI00200C84A3|nr:DUF1329 domain-containing protein [Pseudomonas sp. MWU13-2105]
MNANQWAIALTLALSISAPVLASTAEEAAQLGGNKLTEFGAEKAGNADGSIPAWKPDWKGPTMPENGGIYPDPFPDEKPLLTITAANLEQYADKVSEGTKVLLKRWPDYKVEVYKSHRVVDFPQWLKVATVKNATRAKSTFNGEDLEGAMGGYPFPLPTTGAEVIWNHNLRYYGPPYRSRFSGFMIDSAGNRITTHELDNYTDSPYSDNPEQEQQYYQRRLSTYVGPPRNVGDKALTFMVMHAKQDGNSKTWVYTQGQRRVRQAPEFGYDSPLSIAGGAYFNDELGMWEGQLDRFDFKLVGKKEIYVPYNNYKFLMHTSADNAFGKQFANPDVMRWELHRVWQVEATLKPGMRHAQSKKVFYVDEDSWSIVLYEGYDQAGKIMRSAQGLVTYDWNTKSVPNTPIIIYDLVKGQYCSSMHLTGGIGYLRVARWANGKLTPDSMAGTGIR